MSRPEDKPFAMPKLMVWEAWRQVKAKKGAPGVDDQDLDAFAADLEGNLYREIQTAAHPKALRQVAGRTALETARPVRPLALGALVLGPIRRAR